MYKNENVIKLQNKLKEEGIEAYLIYTSDPHFSEYAAKHFLDVRKYFCPFTGSAGEVLITQNDAFLFADGRYWIQASNELNGSLVKVVRKGDKGVLPLEKFIKNLKINEIAVDFTYLSSKDKARFDQNNIKLVDKDYTSLIEDLVSLPTDKVFKLDDKLNTLTKEEKIKNILDSIEEDGIVISTLDDIAWILNMRGNDVPCNPVFYSYLYLSKKNGNHLFINKKKIDFELKNIEIHEYEDVFEFLRKIDDSILLDSFKTNLKIITSCKNYKLGKNPSTLMKAIKGEKEIENTKKIQALDGLALLKFQKYLEENLDKGLSEYDYSEKLKEYRLSNPLCFELSFDTIAAVGANAAQMHYEPTKEVNSKVTSKEIELLVDSGGQYYGGTTDTTRTFLVGTPTKEYIHDYTLTLKAVINLSRTIFIKGSDGHTIDIRARSYMWNEGMDYKCGTGHGVGYILNVHEGPNGFRYRAVPERDDQGEIVPGMITTIEPGVYKENKYGIRIENNLLCVPAFTTEMGEFYKFETITYVPITLESLDLSLLNKEEIAWINEYHDLVYSKLAPLCDGDKELLEFLKSKTKHI